MARSYSSKEFLYTQIQGQELLTHLKSSHSCDYRNKKYLYELVSDKWISSCLYKIQSQSS